MNKTNLILTLLNVIVWSIGFVFGIIFNNIFFCIIYGTVLIVWSIDLILILKKIKDTKK